MKIAISLGLLLALSPTLDAQARTGKVVATTLSEIRTSPDAYRNVWVRVTVQFASMGKVQNPFFTQFVPGKYANFYVWADEQKIWQQDQYEDLFGLVFMDKENPKSEKIYTTKVYKRMELTGVVRNVFQGQPWIEITDYSFLSDQLNTATLSHIYRGETHMKQRKWQQAIAELSLAPGDGVPSHVIGHIHKDLAMCYLRLGEAEKAVEHIENAVELNNGLDAETRHLARVAKVRPESLLDRTLNNTQVEDHQRPMWEAFEEQNDTTTASDVQPAPTSQKK